MIKVIQSASFDFGMPAVSLIDVHRNGIDRSWMQKRASSELVAVAKNLRPDPGSVFLHLISVGAQEGFGCFAAGTPIDMPNGGYVDVEQVKKGDFVQSGEGYPRLVTHLVKRESDKSVRLKVSALFKHLVSSNDHPYRVARFEQFVCGKDCHKRCLPPTYSHQNICNRYGGCPESVETFREIHVEWSRAEDLRERDFLVCTLPKGKPLFSIGSDEAYLLGAWFAEGSFRRNSSVGKAVSSLRLSTGPAESEYRHLIEAYANLSGWSVHFYDQTEERSEFVVAVTGNPERARLWANTFGTTSRNKRIPPWLCGLSASAKWNLLAGYADGDGHFAVSDKENRATARTASRDLALGMQRFIWSLGVPATVCRVSGVEHYNISFPVSYTPQLAARSVKFRGRELKQTTKVHGFAHGGRMYLPIRSVETEGPIEVFNFGVDTDHTYAGPNVDSHNCNRNGDGFNEKRGYFELDDPKPGTPKLYEMAGGLVDFHRTFTKHAHVFRHHKNDDPKHSIGDVYAECYNPLMKRGELIIKVPLHEHGWEDKIQKLAEGKAIPFSMACRVTYDVCSTCGNEAPSRAQYCDHLKDHMTVITKSGHQIFAINDRPQFFDISEVIRPADRIAYSLYKAAHASIVGGAELAEQLGLQLPDQMIIPDSKAGAAKLAVARKLADIEKQIEVVARGGDNSGIKGLLSSSPCGSIPPSEMEELQCGELDPVLKVLADSKICLSLRDFLQLTMGDKHDAVAGSIPAVEEMLPGIFNRLLKEGSIEECASDSAYDPKPTAIPRKVKETVGKLVEKFSSAPGPTHRRMMAAIVGGRSPRLPGPTALKHASAVSASAAHVAKEYAKYQLSFANSQNDNLTNGLTITRNYLAG